MADEFDQYKVKPADDEFAQYKATSPSTTPQSAPAAPDNRSALSRFLVPDAEQEQGYEDLTKGVGETLAQNGASILGMIPGFKPTSEKLQDLATPANDMQSTGKTIGNVAENVGASLIPGVGELGVLPRKAVTQRT
jgi:hypothetical protein